MRNTINISQAHVRCPHCGARGHRNGHATSPRLRCPNCHSLFSPSDELTVVPQPSLGSQLKDDRTRARQRWSLGFCYVCLAALVIATAVWGIREIQKMNRAKGKSSSDVTTLVNGEPGQQPPVTPSLPQPEPDASQSFTLTDDGSDPNAETVPPQIILVDQYGNPLPSTKRPEEMRPQPPTVTQPDPEPPPQLFAPREEIFAEKAAADANKPSEIGKLPKKPPVPDKSAQRESAWRDEARQYVADEIAQLAQRHTEQNARTRTTRERAAQPINPPVQIAWEDDVFTVVRKLQQQEEKGRLEIITMTFGPRYGYQQDVQHIASVADLRGVININRLLASRALWTESTGLDKDCIAGYLTLAAFPIAIGDGIFELVVRFESCPSLVLVDPARAAAQARQLLGDEADRYWPLMLISVSMKLVQTKHSQRLNDEVWAKIGQQVLEKLRTVHGQPDAAGQHPRTMEVIHSMWRDAHGHELTLGRYVELQYQDSYFSRYFWLYERYRTEFERIKHSAEQLERFENAPPIDDL
ncbi:MAG: hypothetical protein HY372_00010 [Candidatus Andersenbacteria bacterium]|nr:hypothetical protein [Candidatus Andersenbacteria bacterium]